MVVCCTPGTCVCLFQWWQSNNNTFQVTSHPERALCSSFSARGRKEVIQRYFSINFSHTQCVYFVSVTKGKHHANFFHQVRLQSSQSILLYHHCLFCSTVRTNTAQHSFPSISLKKYLIYSSLLSNILSQAEHSQRGAWMCLSSCMYTLF